MMFSEWIRREIFWVQDFLTGSNVRKHFVDIKNIVENDLNPNVSIKHENYLFDILKYATENVEFYKKFKEFNSINSFPVINKNIIRNHYEAFQSLKYLGTPVIKMHTSGSTGAPFVVRQDKNKRNRVYAEMMYFWGKAGYQVGMKYIYFRVWTSLNRLKKMTTLARNIIMHDIQDLGEDNLEDIRNTLKSDLKIRMLLGYGSTLENLANYLLTCGDTSEMFNINTIISFGEVLSEITHEKLKKVFNCNIVSSYSNQENGMLAQECVENKEFHINSASYHIELLKIDSDDSASIGEPGRIVVTDLFNHAMPLIRYDTGDIGVWKKEAECGWSSQVFSSIQGRKVDFIYDTKGNRISPYILSGLFLPFDKILQFQFGQEGPKKYVLKLNGADGHYKDATFVKLFKDILGEGADIEIEHVNEIPVLGSGKRKIVVNNYDKEMA